MMLYRNVRVASQCTSPRRAASRRGPCLIYNNSLVIKVGIKLVELFTLPTCQPCSINNADVAPLSDWNLLANNIFSINWTDVQRTRTGWESMQEQIFRKVFRDKFLGLHGGKIGNFTAKSVGNVCWFYYITRGICASLLYLLHFVFGVTFPLI